MTIAAISIVTNSLSAVPLPCYTHTKLHSTDGTQVNVVIRTGVVLHVNTETGTAVEIFLRNVRSDSSKQTELYNNVFYVDFHIICLNGTWLNDIFGVVKIFPDSSIIYRSDSVSSTKCNAAVITVVSPTVSIFSAGMIYSFITISLVRNFPPEWPQFTYC